MKYKRGDKVTCNGNNEAIVLGYYDIEHRILEVRLWDGMRHIGDTAIGEDEVTND